ncbi:hypothetical protein RFN28_01610 [Mesorhizobium sp. VK24D]|uniref:Uncharacterized protein n=1 Tax=Mesorhizobium album TaxID=3072314 RepID=A0ABU4XR12_9HYPH|nr:hypothetical protein [Mesorhizobium sp. VK24D]MDX8477169.1 hypothetical protein [Mesorhizobium sp. VK24D]
MQQQTLKFVLGGHSQGKAWLSTRRLSADAPPIIIFLAAVALMAWSLSYPLPAEGHLSQRHGESSCINNALPASVEMFAFG